MPRIAEPTPIETLKAIANAWNANDLTKDQIAETYGRTPGWLDNRLAEARAAGLMVNARRLGRGLGAEYPPDLLDEVAKLLRQGLAHKAIVAALGKSSDWVSHAKYVLRCRGVDLSPLPKPGVPTFDDVPTRSSRPVATRQLGGLTISLPYLRCLDPEAARA